MGWATSGGGGGKSGGESGGGDGGEDGGGCDGLGWYEKQVQVQMGEKIGKYR